MNPQKFRHGLQLRLSLGLAVVSLGLFAPQTPAGSSTPLAPKAVKPAEDEFGAVSRSVVALLRSRDAARFAREITASAEDWEAIASTNLPEIAENLKGFANGADSQRAETEAAAKAFLARADSLHLDFSKGDLHERVVNPRFLGTAHYPNLQAEGESLPHAQKVEIILNPDAGTNNQAGGEYKIVLRRLNKFPKGWRCAGGIQWVSFPSNVGDEKTAREMAILEKAASPGLSRLTDKDDPALLRLGQTLVRFIRERDTNIYAKEALANSDLYWAMMQKRGEKGPSRKELDEEINRRTQEQTEIARAMLNQSEAAGIDFKDAQIQIQEASIGRLQLTGASGSVEGLIGEQFKLKLAVKTGAKSRTGTSLSGDYILAVKQVMRFTDDWKAVGNVSWNQVPAGVLDEKAAAAMEVENYIAEHDTLPPGAAVPEIEFTTLDGEKKMKLSDLRGKVVVLDFWATWCGPCQGPMADLQKLRQAHSDWGDKVAVVPLSIDDTLDIVRHHVNKRGWTNTFNVWAGDGGWGSAPAKAFRVSGVPTTYLIDAQGKIVVAGHPAALPIEEKVEAALHGTKE
ncbi:MAG: TlpA disulfide reductase family protein [Verrucomicrobiota bacterium]|jgi:thiol-disulfide isomerase/thioredoxin